MITAGIDIGSTTIKVAILDQDRVLASLVAPAGGLPAETARSVFRQALDQTGVAESGLAAIATTGYGRRLVDFGDLVMTEIKACAAGVRHCLPADTIRTIIDVGGQDTKVIALTPEGDIEEFSMNDKCAAGTGRFLEMLAAKLGLAYEEFVSAAVGSLQTVLQMNATCAVFAESEVVGLLARGEPKGDIAAAAHHAIASRIASMVRRVAYPEQACFVGGGARNQALVKTVEEHLNAPVRIPDTPQTVVAIGAAVCAQRKLQNRGTTTGAEI